jgi:hypothetical protein
VWCHRALRTDASKKISRSKPIGAWREEEEGDVEQHQPRTQLLGFGLFQQDEQNFLFVLQREGKVASS